MLTTAAQPAVPEVWDSLAVLLGLRPGERKRLWRALSSCKHPGVKAFVYRVAAFEDHLASPALRQRAIDAFLAGTWCPKALVAALERCVEEGLLPRALTNKAEEAVLAWTDKAGQWDFAAGRHPART